ncbi:hypothetical protein AB0C76_08505 [Kitasatospora sp. NPDC048722]|uniref:hypothetical protein n=1 Tax=Kitasatospora sp. NPDC048722 TaxID=3155639 RepID=UPI0033D7E5BD
MYDDFDPYDYSEHPTRDEEKAAEIALDLADEQRLIEAERAAGPQPGHTEMCEGCRGSGAAYEEEDWDAETGDVSFLLSPEDYPECGGCGYYDCDATCEFAQDADES